MEHNILVALLLMQEVHILLNQWVDGLTLHRHLGLLAFPRPLGHLVVVSRRLALVLNSNVVVRGRLLSILLVLRELLLVKHGHAFNVELLGLCAARPLHGYVSSLKSRGPFAVVLDGRLYVLVCSHYMPHAAFQVIRFIKIGLRRH